MPPPAVVVALHTIESAMDKLSKREKMQLLRYIIHKYRRVFRRRPSEEENGPRTKTAAQFGIEAVPYKSK